MLHQNLKTKSLPSSGPKLKVTTFLYREYHKIHARHAHVHTRALGGIRFSVLKKGKLLRGGDAAHAAHVQKHGQRGGGMATACMTHPQSPAAPLSGPCASGMPRRSALPTPAGPVTRSTDRAHGERQRAWRGHLRPDGRRPLLVLLISIDSGARCAGADLVAALMSRA